MEESVDSEITSNSEKSKSNQSKKQLIVKKRKTPQKTLNLKKEVKTETNKDLSDGETYQPSKKKSKLKFKSQPKVVNNQMISSKNESVNSEDTYDIDLKVLISDKESDEKDFSNLSSDLSESSEEKIEKIDEKKNSLVIKFKSNQKSTKINNDDMNDENDENEKFDQSNYDYYEEEDFYDDFENTISGERKMTTRQKALLKGERGELYSLTGSKNSIQTPIVDPKKNPIKEAIYKPKVERTDPPKDVLDEMHQIISQLLERPNLVVQQKTQHSTENLNNPQLIKTWSRENEKLVTFPPHIYEEIFKSNLGWQTILKEDLKSIETIRLKRDIFDIA